MVPLSEFVAFNLKEFHCKLEKIKATLSDYEAQKKFIYNEGLFEVCAPFHVFKPGVWDEAVDPINKPEVLRIHQLFNPEDADENFDTWLKLGAFFLGKTISAKHFHEYQTMQKYMWDSGPLYQILQKFPYLRSKFFNVPAELQKNPFSDSTKYKIIDAANLQVINIYMTSRTKNMHQEPLEYSQVKIYIQNMIKLLDLIRKHDNSLEDRKVFMICRELENMCDEKFINEETNEPKIIIKSDPPTNKKIEVCNMSMFTKWFIL